FLSVLLSGFRGMPGLQSNSGAVSHDRAILEALEQFCSSPEQSYEQFLSTFTYLTTEIVRESLKDLRGDNSSTFGEMNRRNREVTDRGVDTMYEGESRSNGEQNQDALTAHLEEVATVSNSAFVLDGSVIVGRLGNEETLPSDPPVKFDNYLDETELEVESLQASCQATDDDDADISVYRGIHIKIRDVHSDLKTQDASIRRQYDVLSLPGEVEDYSPGYAPSFCHHTQLEFTSTAKFHAAHTPQTTTEFQSEAEEVVPFSLDDTFDYDNVVLSHKHQHSTSGSP
ncbi:hypothetical protein NFI96_027139, partial [Prochilodus magdalenae]